MRQHQQSQYDTRYDRQTSFIFCKRCIIWILKMKSRRGVCAACRWWLFSVFHTVGRRYSSWIMNAWKSKIIYSFGLYYWRLSLLLSSLWFVVLVLRTTKSLIQHLCARLREKVGPLCSYQRERGREGERRESGLRGMPVVDPEISTYRILRERREVHTSTNS